ncbi:MAG: hypothetical protein ABIP93_21620 [Gemmatimonadaceae bacterium]
MAPVNRRAGETPLECDEDSAPRAMPADSYRQDRTRPEPKPGSLAHARMGIAERPQGVAERTWERIAVHVERALCRATTRGASMLRPSVTRLALEMRASGASWESIEAAVTDAVCTHPDLGAHDRLNVVSGKRSSVTLIAQMVGWVHGVRQLEAPAGSPPRRASGDRIDVERADQVLEQLTPALDRHLALERARDVQNSTTVQPAQPSAEQP